VLSDPTRRKEYDILYTSQRKTDDPNSSANFFASFANMFAGAGAGPSTAEPGRRPDANDQFANVFEEVCSFHSP
jgi:DnaJ-class molecular chaperone